MGQFSKTFLAVPALGLLAACGGGGATVGSGGNLDPVFALDPGPGLIGLDAKVYESLIDPDRGATGYVVVYDQFSPNPQIRQLKIGLSPDLSEITITITGVTNETLDALGTPSTLGGSYGDNFTPEIPFVTTLHSFNTGLFGYTKTVVSGGGVDNTSAQGVYGIETPYDRVPVSATYTGDLSGFGIPTIGNATINGVDGDITINLSGTSVSGSFAGNTQVDGSSFNDATGTMTGSVSDNVLSGTLSISSSGSSYSGNFVAKLYGWNADDVAGVWEGTVTPDGGSTQQAFGTFEAN